MKLPLITLFGEITRRDDVERIVEGYVFVNSEVGDGINLTRAAMESATDDYMRWGAVREMHGKNAAGTAIDLTWDDKGALFRCKVIDDQAWEKVKGGVYKGFSVGVKPTVVRGKDVTSCVWVENSLVDRPKDPDAVISLHRAEDFNGETEFEVEEARVEDADLLTRFEALEGENTELLARVESLNTENDNLLIRLQTTKEERDLAHSKMDELQDEITRVAEMSNTRGELIERLGLVMSEVPEEKPEQMITRAIELLKKPDPEQDKPLRITAKHLVERIASGGSEEELTAKAKAKERFEEITRTDWATMTDEQKSSALLEIEGLKQTLAG